MDIRLSHRRPRLELSRVIVVESGVPAQPIVEHFNVLKDVLSRLISCTVLPMVDELTLERPKKLSTQAAVAGAAHARGNAVLAEQPLVATCRVLAAVIRVVQQPGRGCPVCQRHDEGTLGQIHG